MDSASLKWLWQSPEGAYVPYWGELGIETKAGDRNNSIHSALGRFLLSTVRHRCSPCGLTTKEDIHEAQDTAMSLYTLSFPTPAGPREHPRES